jgi:GTPase SAR1 family protein
MRIERIVAGSFTEASERTKERFGRDAILLSTHQVGELTELLVGVDDTLAAIHDSGKLPDSGRLPDFDSVLREEIFVPVKAQAGGVEPARAKPPKAEPARVEPVTGESAKVEDGEALVRTIRKELQALERRLAVTGKITRAVPEQIFALLEQGVSASYAHRMLERSEDSAEMAAGLVQDLQPQSVAARCAETPVVLVGPPGAGKTTLSVQLARHLNETTGDGTNGIVGSVRDRRPGARERFFALADGAGLEARWAQAANTTRVLDGSGLETAAEISALLGQAHSGRGRGGEGDLGGDRAVLLCLSANVSRSAAARWLKDTSPVGVLISHWDSMQLPLGLLSLLAESGTPLCGVSASADPAADIEIPDASELQRDLGHLIQLSLHDIPPLTE